MTRRASKSHYGAARRAVIQAASGFLVLLAVGLAEPLGAQATPPRRPNFLLLSVDTLRPDRLSGYGYERPTSPNLDRLMAAGARFEEARTVVALTCPALTTMVTTLEPHEHGSSRNGLRSRAGLPSFPKVLKAHGYATAAIVSNYTLKERLCGLGEHFSHWQEVLKRRRLIFGAREARAGDVTKEALSWLEDHVRAEVRRPFLLWVHYVEPHFPWQLQERHASRLGIRKLKGAFSARDRYDTEIAAVDESIGHLLERSFELVDPASTIVLFTADHGESLGHHGYWGHGKHVYEDGLRIPLAVIWKGQIEPQTVAAPALLTDVARTLFGLARFPIPEFLGGFDWSGVLRDERAPPQSRVTYHQAHRGAVQPSEKPVRLRRKGLLEVCLIEDGRKEVLRVRQDSRLLFELNRDPDELKNIVPLDSTTSQELLAWLEEVKEGLERSDTLPPTGLDKATLDQLRTLGYLD